MHAAAAAHDGTLCTFYSYKGGVGRTQALANVAVVLARWGYRVLCIDWDLEAPGLHLYFRDQLGGRVGDGVVELMTGHEAGARLAWERHVQPVRVDERTSLDLMPAGRLDGDYGDRMQALAWERLYTEQELGLAVECMRDELRDAYDFVLVDSRTGITDMGGICAVQLPDLLVALTTASHQSLDGVLGIVATAAERRQLLPFERGQVPTLPVITRFEATVEVQLAQDWMLRFEQRFAGVVAPWIHRDVSLEELLPLIRVPHVAHWSFGEHLPVLEEGTADPAGIGYAFETLAALIANRLERSELLVGNRRAYVESAGMRLRGGESPYDVYVAASRDQRDYAGALARALEQRDLRVLAMPSDDAGRQRGTHQQRARNVVLVCGESSPTLDQEARAFVLASATDPVPRRLVPVLRAGPEAVPPIASDHRWIDGRETPLDVVVLDITRAVQEQLLELYDEMEGADAPVTVRAAERLARTLLELGDATAAAALLGRASEAARDGGLDERLALDVMGTHADALSQIGRHRESLELAAEALERARHRSGGDDGVEVAHALQRLARARFAAGEPEVAAALVADAAQILERELGDEHRDTLDALNGLAQMRLIGGHLTEAQELADRVVETGTRVLGADDRVTLVGLGVQARLLLDRGQTDEARLLNERIVEVLRRQLGPEHHETLTALNNLANVLHSQGDPAAAHELEQRVLEVRQRVLGDEHPDTLTAMANLAVASAETGDHLHARELEERVLERRRRLLGSDHPDTLGVMANLAQTHRELGDLDAAAALGEQVLERRRVVLGADHLDTLAAEASLASTRLAAGDFEAARRLYERALAGYEQSLGPDHRATLTSAGNLAHALYRLDDLAAARELEERVVRGMTRQFGARHPETVAAIGNLAITLRELGDLEGARALQEQVVAYRIETSGDDALDTARDMVQLAATLQSAGELSRALELQERALAVIRRELGLRDAETFVTSLQMADTLRKLGQDDAATELLERFAREAERRPAGRAPKDRGG